MVFRSLGRVVKKDLMEHVNLDDGPEIAETRSGHSLWSVTSQPERPLRPDVK